MEKQVPKEDIDKVILSYGAVISNEKFLQRFYEIFMNSDPRITPLFKNTDFSKQFDLLHHGISMALLFSQKSKTAEMAIARLGESHNRDHLNINPKLYPFWLDSLVQALREFDTTFTDDLERQWRSLMQVTIDFLTEKH